MDYTPLFIFAWLILAVILIMYFEFNDLDDQILMILLAPVVLLGLLAYSVFEKFSKTDRGEG
ncbi:MAG: hypothetical protein ACPG5T_01250 [Endozoicomonas sp.]